jgi:UDP-N-acetylglucosamine--N-acetylmuramyl-(pentapeptide) pyrophosphoryl-undecaprenol N-acetylglucosamine transferase
MMIKPTKRLMIMAAGTGGHIFPGIAIAQTMRARGWEVSWLGTAHGMEKELVPKAGIPMDSIDFAGLRGKGLKHTVTGAFKMAASFLTVRRYLGQRKPDVVLGMGGYVTVPGGMMARTRGVPLALVNADAALLLSNKTLAPIAQRVLFGFPADFGKAAGKAVVTGNPVRQQILDLPVPSARFEGRSGPLRVLVVGGSLGAKALNEVVPKALALIPAEQRPHVLHQSGAKQIDELRANYEKAGVQAELTPFIDDTASAFAEADLVICRAGASTVTEIAAVGAAALFVPFPSAVDDHQTTNAKFLVDAGAGWLVQQKDLTPDMLAQQLLTLEREELVQRAVAARKLQKTQATEQMVAACEELAS